MKRITSSSVVLIFVTMFVLLVLPQAQARDDNGCSNASVQGGYGFMGSNSSIVGIGPTVAVGSFTADGNGNIVGKFTESISGLIVRQTFTATYTVNADCTGSATAVFQPSGSTGHFSFVVVGGNQVFNIQTDPGTIVTFTDKKQSGEACSNATVAGSYGFTGTGSVVGIGPVSSVGSFTSDGNGNVTAGSDTTSLNGSIAQETFAGNYTLNPDCTGSASFVAQPGSRMSHFDFVVVNEDGNEILAAQTDPGTVISSINRRVRDSDE